jgi:hypothetical protein
MSMLLSRPLPLSSSAVGPRSRGGAVRVFDSRSELPFDASALVGEKLGRWLKTPVDLLAFGPRMGAGALVSTPMKLQSIQSDIERVMELIQDPRPLTEKQEVLFKEVEDTMLEFLEKGTDVEQDVLSNLKTMLPAEAANMLSELIPEPPNKQSAIVVVPMESGEYTTYQKEDVAANQVQSEVTEIKVSGWPLHAHAPTIPRQECCRAAAAARNACNHSACPSLHILSHTSSLPHTHPLLLAFFLAERRHGAQGSPRGDPLQHRSLPGQHRQAQAAGGPRPVGQEAVRGLG